jgi:hypothetical protein
VKLKTGWAKALLPGPRSGHVSNDRRYFPMSGIGGGVYGKRDGRTAATGASAACEAAVLLNRVSGQSAENCSCVIRDASKPRTQSRHGEVNKRIHWLISGSWLTE